MPWKTTDARSDDFTTVEDDTVWTGTVTYRYQHLGAPYCLPPQLTKKSTKRAVSQDYPTDGSGQLPRDIGNHIHSAIHNFWDGFFLNSKTRAIYRPTQ